MRFSLKDVEADVWSRDWTRPFGPSYHSGRTNLSPDVQSVCDRETQFSTAVP
jgi:hypothetical protein